MIQQINFYRERLLNYEQTIPSLNAEMGRLT